MASKSVHDAHVPARLRELHGAVIDIVGIINGRHRDELIIREAGIQLDRALFPLLALIGRLGPLGVGELADRVGRDYTTVSRQLAKLDDLGLVSRRASATDRRVTEGVITPAGRSMTDRIDAARDRLLRAGFADWEPDDVATLATLMRRFADSLLSAG